MIMWASPWLPLKPAIWGWLFRAHLRHHIWGNYVTTQPLAHLKAPKKTTPKKQPYSVVRFPSLFVEFPLGSRFDGWEVGPNFAIES